MRQIITRAAIGGFFFFSMGGANSSQPASGCVFLRHMCESSREEKRQRAAGTNPSATQITSGLSGHIGAQRA